jgi:hypothetical protein
MASSLPFSPETAGMHPGPMSAANDSDVENISPNANVPVTMPPTVWNLNILTPAHSASACPGNSAAALEHTVEADNLGESMGLPSEIRRRASGSSLFLVHCGIYATWQWRRRRQAQHFIREFA